MKKFARILLPLFAALMILLPSCSSEKHLIYQYNRGLRPATAKSIFKHGDNKQWRSFPHASPID
jgi:hypothetical protein